MNTHPEGWLRQDSSEAEALSKHERELLEASLDAWEACHLLHETEQPHREVEGGVNDEEPRPFAGPQWQIATSRGARYTVQRRHYTDTDEYTWRITGDEVPATVQQAGYAPPFAIELWDTRRPDIRCFRRQDDKAMGSRPSMGPPELLSEVAQRIKGYTRRRK